MPEQLGATEPAAGLGAVPHLVPVAAPSFAPGHRAAAGGARLWRQVLFVASEV